MTPGNEPNSIFNNMDQPAQPANIVDENYLIIGGNLDGSIIAKIVRHEYIDFARLLPKDRISAKEDHQMELVSRAGSTFCVPVSDRELGGIINNFLKWEQAFRVFSNVYTRYYPERASELIQYNQLIHTASHTFVWDNVYRYDKEFHIHFVAQ